ncbi:MAG: hypothetical protein II920_08455 [Clostridia bacterium]|nr:hypothetical protein [Clostridia bacterium]
MYRKLYCDWFLTDDVFAPVRLDAPMTVEEALTASGRIPAEMSYEEHMKVEWIYRRRWRYFTDFKPEAAQRMFLRLSGLKGSWQVLLNGAEAARGTDSAAAFEATQGLREGTNRLEVCFDADISGELRPVTGFGGMLSCRLGGKVAITRLELSEDDRIFLALDSANGGEVEIRLNLKNPSGRYSHTFTETLNAGYTPLAVSELKDKLMPGEANEIEAHVYTDGEVSDEAVFICFLPTEFSLPRGFVADTEETISLAENAGALSAFTMDSEPNAAHRLLSARHGLESLSAAELEIATALPALKPYDELMSISGGEEGLGASEMWALSGSSIKDYEAMASRVASGDVEHIVSCSRYIQGRELRFRALDARLSKNYLALDGVADKLFAPASRALLDCPGRPRPAYFALMSAWQSEVGYVKPVSAQKTDGIVSCEVYLVCDAPVSPVDALHVEVYDIKGRKVLGNSFPAVAQGCVGRFTVELPENGCAIMRTALVKGEESVMSTDEIVFADGVTFEDMPLTQLLSDGGRVTNVGEHAALGVCVPGARYFGCLLPGESVKSTLGDPDAAEGLNIFM